MTTAALDTKRLSACIHCGLCLEACPTYITTGEEMSSPRGRLYLMKGITEGSIDVRDESFETHELSCLVCRSCETACPSGVEFSYVMEQTRELLTHAKPNALRSFIYTRLLQSKMMIHISQFFLALLTRLGVIELAKRFFRERGRSSRLGSMMLLAPREVGFPSSRPNVYPAIGTLHGSVGVLIGCIGDVFTQKVNDSAIHVLRTLGYDVHTLPEIQCCGSLAAHNGYGGHTRKLAAYNIEMFRESNVEHLITMIAGCGAMLKDYSSLLGTNDGKKFSAQVFDISEFLLGYNREELAKQLQPFSKLTRIGYHAPCHLTHGQHITSEPVELLRLIPNAEVFPFDENEICCGSAGSYNIEHPDMADELLSRKMRIITSAQPDVIATANAGCMMQLQKQSQRQVRHVIEIIAEQLS